MNAAMTALQEMKILAGFIIGTFYFNNIRCAVDTLLKGDTEGKLKRYFDMNSLGHETFILYLSVFIGRS